MDVTPWMDELAELHGRLGGCFSRKEPRDQVLSYLKGLLGPAERKNGWQLAEQADENRLVKLEAMAPVQTPVFAPVFEEGEHEKLFSCRIPTSLKAHRCPRRARASARLAAAAMAAGGPAWDLGDVSNIRLAGSIFRGAM